MTVGEKDLATEDERGEEDEPWTGLAIALHPMSRFYTPSNLRGNGLVDTCTRSARGSLSAVHHARTPEETRRSLLNQTILVCHAWKTEQRS